MKDFAAKFELQRRSWGKLRQIHPAKIDLGRIDSIRAADPGALADSAFLEEFLIELGLNDDGLEDFPESLRAHCGTGLRIWQYPREFSQYLAQLIRLGVRSYLELGVRHGGTFVTTVECLARCCGLQRAVGVDIMHSPSVVDYAAADSGVHFLQVNTQSAEFERALGPFGDFDLALIDANHDETECRNETRLLEDRCSMIAYHDIANSQFPDVGKVWADVKQCGRYECHEYVSDYAEAHTPMGIGLAIKKTARMK